MILSTGLRNRLLAQEPLRTALSGSVIRIYEGAAPATADAALPGSETLLVEVSVDGTGTGITLESSAAAGVIAKNSSEVWKGTVATSGNAQFFRIVQPADTGGASSTAVRIQGTVGAAGRDMNISNPSLVASAEQKVEYFTIAQPAA